MIGREGRVFTIAALLVLWLCSSFSSTVLAVDYKEPPWESARRPLAGNTATLSVGSGQKSVSVTVSPHGVFGSSSEGGSANYWPVGRTAASSTVYESGVYFSKFGFLHAGGIDGTALAPGTFTSVTSTRAESSFTVGSFGFQLMQELIATDAGAQLVQTYSVTNNRPNGEEFAMIRHVDGDLYFDGVIDDSGGLGQIGTLPALYEFDSGDDPQNPTTFFGITVEGGNYIGYRIAAYRFTDDILSGGAGVLNNTIANDTDGNGITNSNYDVTLSMGCSYQLGAGQTGVFRTITYWGKGAISSSISVAGNLRVVQVVDTNNSRLVAKKDTAVRVYLNTGVDGIPVKLKGTLTVDGTTQIQAAYGGQACYTAYRKDYFSDAFDSENRYREKGGQLSRGEDSMNFFIRGGLADSLLGAGNRTFSLQLQKCDNSCSNCVSVTPTGNTSATAEFKATRPLSLFVVPVEVLRGDNSTESPAATDLARVGDHVKAVYPVDEEAVETRILTALSRFSLDNNDQLSGNRRDDLRLAVYNAGLQYIRSQVCADSCTQDPEGNACRQCVLDSSTTNGSVIVGVLPGSVPICNANGCTVCGWTNTDGTDIPTTIQKTTCGAAFDLDRTLSHEIGHTRPFCLDDEYDFSTATWRRDNGRSFMCGGNQRFNPVEVPIVGTHTGGVDSQVLVDSAHNFKTAGIPYGVWVRHAIPWGRDKQQTIAEVVSETALRVRNDADWDTNDGYRVFAYSNVDPTGNVGSGPGRTGNFVTFRAGAMNLSYGRYTVETPVYWTGAEPTFSFMSAGGVRAWADTAVYNRLFDQWVAPAQVAGRSPQGARSPLAVRKVVVVSGILSRMDAVTIEPLVYINTDQAMSESSGGNYAVVLYDVQGTELARKVFDASFEVFTDTGVEITDTAHFSVVMECPQNLHQVRVVKVAQAGGATVTARVTAGSRSPQGDVVLGSLTKPPSIPAIHITYPAGGEILGGSQTLVWTSSLPNLRFTVFFSSDGGFTYKMLASNYLCTSTACSRSIDFGKLPGSANCRIKVVGSDGFNASEDVSQLFSVGNKAPEVAIVSPSPGSLLQSGTPVTLSASAADAEDGPLGADRISWTSSVDGDLGTGRTITFRPSQGIHTITVTAKDSNNTEAQASVVVNVGQTNQIPRANAGPDQYVRPGDSVALDGSGSTDPNLDQLTFAWTQTGGPGVNLSGANTGTPQFTAPNVHQITRITLSLMVNDGSQNGIPDEVTITVTPETFSRTLPLNQGWNLISLPIQPSTGAAAGILNEIEGDYDILWSFTNGTWKWYEAQDRDGSSAAEIVPGIGYWIKMRQARSINLEGEVLTRTVPLGAGWNLVGFNSTEPISLQDAIRSIADKLIVIWSYQNGSWKVFDNTEPGIGDLNTMEPGFGYWIKTTGECIWALP